MTALTDDAVPTTDEVSHFRPQWVTDEVLHRLTGRVFRRDLLTEPVRPVAPYDGRLTAEVPSTSRGDVAEAVTHALMALGPHPSMSVDKFVDLGNAQLRLLRRSACASTTCRGPRGDRTPVGTGPGQPRAGRYSRRGRTSAGHHSKGRTRGEPDALTRP